MALHEELINYSEGFYNWITVESIKNAIEFQPRPSDVIISTSPKSGTTWMQQITHQLRTGGDMDFDVIDEVVPHMEVALDKSRDLQAEQKAKPRLFKTHFPSSHCPKNCKHIVVYRNPCSVAYSFYKFQHNISTLIPATVTLREFVEGTWLGHPDTPSSVWPLHVSYFTHLLSWYERRNNPNVLILFYEEMKEDPKKAICAVASFLDVQDEKKIQAALTMSSFSFMKENMVKFDFNSSNVPKKSGIVLPFIRTGSADEGIKNLPNDSKAAIQAKWESTVTNVTGCKTYEELRHRIREERPL